jgi:hypothetical protein
MNLMDATSKRAALFIPLHKQLLPLSSRLPRTERVTTTLRWQLAV